MTLQQLQGALATPVSSADSAEHIAMLQQRLGQLRSSVDRVAGEGADAVKLLETSSNALGANYYWLVFVLIYGGVYLFQ